MPSRTALLVGATGLVGGHCLDLLLADARYRRVTVLSRRPLARTHDRLEVREVNFDPLDRVPAADDVYCGLGTTIAAAGSRQAFYRVDHDYPVAVARLARQAGASRFALVSSIGASTTARNYYLRMKGETERDIAALEYECLELFRPSMLLGDRPQRRPREAAGMAVMRVASPLLAGPARAYRPVDARHVAAAMVAAIGNGEPGVHIRRYDDIERLAGGDEQQPRS